MSVLTLVAAVAENGVIGRGDDLPWHISSDLKRFRAITWGKPILMGRRTFESIGKPLPGRTSIVISRDAGFLPPAGVRVEGSLDAALEAGARVARELGVDEMAVIGGAQIYALAFPHARRLRLTQVHASPEGDVHFPRFDAGEWREASREGPFQGEKDEYPFSYVDYDRV
ncbi:dihydrofolate reductase [Angulomicrobium tetraedrale]|uniref:Dihydrofolate reductase n=1 Tax=Ancylobacter tetraedralis TaxID=217068 RepID=A0A839ZCP5_9HYPH|nr:dihydrofolate reductase [Ancylobacter tetraedralis]